MTMETLVQTLNAMEFRNPVEVPNRVAETRKMRSQRQLSDEEYKKAFAIPEAQDWLDKKWEVERINRENIIYLRELFTLENETKNKEMIGKKLELLQNRMRDYARREPIFISLQIEIADQKNEKPNWD